VLIEHEDSSEDGFRNSIRSIKLQPCKDFARMNAIHLAEEEQAQQLEQRQKDVEPVAEKSSRKGAAAAAQQKWVKK